MSKVIEFQIMQKVPVQTYKEEIRPYAFRLPMIIKSRQGNHVSYILIYHAHETNFSAITITIHDLHMAGERSNMIAHFIRPQEVYDLLQSKTTEVGSVDDMNEAFLKWDRQARHEINYKIQIYQEAIGLARGKEK